MTTPADFRRELDAIDAEFEAASVSPERHRGIPEPIKQQWGKRVTKPIGTLLDTLDIGGEALFSSVGRGGLHEQPLLPDHRVSIGGREFAINPVRSFERYLQTREASPESVAAMQELGWSGLGKGILGNLGDPEDVRAFEEFRDTMAREYGERSLKDQVIGGVLTDLPAGTAVRGAKALGTVSPAIIGGATDIARAIPRMTGAARAVGEAAQQPFTRGTTPWTQGSMVTGETPWLPSALKSTTIPVYESPVEEIARRGPQVIKDWAGQSIDELEKTIQKGTRKAVDNISKGMREGFETPMSRMIERGTLPGISRGAAEEAAEEAAIAARRAAARAGDEVVEDIDFFGVRTIGKGGLTPIQRLLSGLRRGADDPRIAMTREELAEQGAKTANVVEQLDVRIASLSNAVKDKINARIASAFDVDDKGRIQSLKNVFEENGVYIGPTVDDASSEFYRQPAIRGAPTIQDVAARRPIYDRHLTEKQKDVLDGIRSDLKPLQDEIDIGKTNNKAWAEDVGRRADIMPHYVGQDPSSAGFYIPRGTGTELIDGPRPLDPTSARRGGGAYRETAKYPSMSYAIEEGVEYKPVMDSISAYIRRVGGDITNEHVGGILRGAQDADGSFLGVTEKAMGYSRIEDMPTLNNWYFPNALADAYNSAMRATRPPAGQGTWPIKTMQAINNLYRAVRATADNSAIGIQGLLGLANDQKAFGDALNVNLRAWRDGKALGGFIIDFDAKAAKNNRLTSSMWARDGLRIGGAQTEYQLTGALERFQNIQGVRQANRAFGFFGDSLRLGWADDLLKSELDKGRSLADIRASGDLRKIAESANRMTGWTNSRAFSQNSDFLFFAPRFLQSRLETVTKAAMGLRPGAPLDQRIARNSMVRMIAYAALITHAVNAAQGRETEWQPIIRASNGDLRYNPNFMRMRVAGRDISILGPWDSIVRMMMSMSLGTAHADLGEAAQPYRSVSSGVVGLGWDMLANETFTGQKVFDSENPGLFGSWILSNLTPFSWQEAIPTAKDFAEAAKERDVGKMAGAPLVVGMEAIGIKSSPLSFIDTANEVSEELGFGPYDSLKEKYLQNEVRENHRLVELTDGRPAQSDYWNNLDRIDAEFDLNEQWLVDNKGSTQNGVLIDEAYIRSRYAEIKEKRYKEKQTMAQAFGIEHEQDDIESLDERERALAIWHAQSDLAEIGEGGRGGFNVDKLFDDRNRFYNSLSGSPDLQEYILRNIELRRPHPVIFEALSPRQKKRIQMSEDARRKHRAAIERKKPKAKPLREAVGEAAISPATRFPEWLGERREAIQGNTVPTIR